MTENGEYNHEAYVKTYHEVLELKPNGGRLIDFVNFYPVSDNWRKKKLGKQTVQNGLQI